MDMCPSKNKDAPTQQQLVRKKEREWKEEKMGDGIR
jgi:hypothetical protein